ncbi:MAG: ComF family protein [Holosporales bacterium]|jgi:ComF family protein|nr:ComF family protein [Holosporales bacterium]
MDILRFFKRMTNILLPPHCVCCQEPITGDVALCATCWKKLSLFHTPWCARCGTPLNFELPGENICEECSRKFIHIFDGARSVAAYQGSARTLVLKLKHADAAYLAPLMGSLMQRAIKDLKNVDYVIPVPLHWRRLLKRKYNQSALLAYYLTKKRHLPYAPSFLKRHRATPSQKGHNAQERYENVEGAFSVTKKGYLALERKNVLLIDDVWTTGATLTSCTKTLRKAGVSKVYVLTFARVLKGEALVRLSEDTL